MTNVEFNKAVYARLSNNLWKYGSTLSLKHAQALRTIITMLTDLASGQRDGRYAYDLQCGGGKTQALVAFAAEIHHQQKPWPILICASKVEELCNIKRELIANGVRDEAIGLVHSYGKQASLPATEDNENRIIMLVTHNRVRGNEDIRRYNSYHGEPRRVVVWDESLLISQPEFIELRAIEQALGYIRPDARDSKRLAAVYDYLEACWKALEHEYHAQRGNRSPRGFMLPQRSAEELDDMLAVLGSLRDRAKFVASDLKNLIQIAPMTVRVVSAVPAGALVTYTIAVPDELQNVVVLDASYAIRELCQRDRTIKRDPAFDGSIKQYSQVTIHQLRAASGREAMTEDFDRNREDRKVSAEIVDVVKGIPVDQGILIFTFKARPGLDMQSTLRHDLKANRINVDAILPDGNPRFVWLTWGQETSASEFAYCSNVIFAGVLHRSEADLAGAFVGQCDNLQKHVSSWHLMQIRRSEIAHCLYQAMSRGSCRMTIDGEAKPMNVWLIHKDAEIRPLIDRVMPGVVWKTWNGIRLNSVEPIIENAAKAILAYLQERSPSVQKLSVKQLKRDLHLEAMPNSTFQLAKDAAMEGLHDWKFQDRSVIRC